MEYVRLLLWLALLLPWSGLAADEPLPAFIRQGDGGRTTLGARDTLAGALTAAGCPVQVALLGATDPPPAEAALVYDHAPLTAGAPLGAGFRPLAQALTSSGATAVRGAVVVHQSVGLTSLTPLGGEPIAFVSPHSPSGYLAPRQLLDRRKVALQEERFVFVNDHVGALSMLIHRDVYAAVLAEPVAREMAAENRLVIVATTDPITTGGWWVREGLPAEEARACATALERLQPEQRLALPQWIGGFAAKSP